MMWKAIDREKSVITFQCTSKKNKTDTDNLHDDDILTPADLMTFAWQIAKGMVRAALRATCRDQLICFAICDYKI